MTPSEQGDSPKRSKRRRKSCQQAYDEGLMIGFMGAIELIYTLKHPDEFIAEIHAMQANFADALRAMRGED